jgi:RNA polymerase sigma-70 factor (ECF subfamily)
MLATFPNVRRWDDTDDVFQNAAMRLHRTLGRLPITSPRDVFALAATELHRELLDLARRHAGPMSFAANHATNFPEQRGCDGSPVPRGVSNTPAPDEDLDRWSLFHEAIVALPDDLREVFHLAWYLDADQRTIAGIMGCSERTVRSRWLEAREAVRAVVDGQRPM